MTKTIKVPFKKLKWIHHISDIQGQKLKKTQRVRRSF